MTKLAEYTYDELLDESNTLAAEMADIKAQIDIAKGEAMTKGQYRDPVWFAKAKQALRFKGIEHQEILQEIGRRNKERKQKYAESCGKYFIKAAQELLPKELFDRIMARVDELLDSQ